MIRITIPREERSQFLKCLLRVDRLASRGKYLEAHSILVVLRLGGLSDFTISRIVSDDNLRALADWRGHHVN